MDGCNMDTKLDLIIIGSGPSGIYAGHLAKLHNLKFKILEASNEPGGQLNLFKDKPVYDFPAHTNINGKEILDAFVSQLNLNENKFILYDEELSEISGDYENYSVFTKKNHFLTRNIIFANGGGMFKPVKLRLENEETFSNIYYNVENIEKFKNKKLVICGGGDSAIDWAHFFLTKNNKVILIHRRDKFRGQENLLNEVKKQAEVLTPYKVTRLLGDSIVREVEILNIKTNESKKINCDEVFVFYGQKKIKKGVNSFNLKEDKNGLLVNTNMKTSREGIYAIGNAASYEGKVKIMITGLGEAATAIGSIVEKIFPGKKMSYYVKKKEN